VQRPSGRQGSGKEGKSGAKPGFFSAPSLKKRALITGQPVQREKGQEGIRGSGKGLAALQERRYGNHHAGMFDEAGDDYSGISSCPPWHREGSVSSADKG